MTDYLTLTEVLAIHDDQIACYGGADGGRDFGLLEAALYGPVGPKLRFWPSRRTFWERGIRY